ncbi:hypothetical protein GCM10019016_030720 [Streptomyces prasinosporus]|uniref:Uncharacterized protein n=1 Tax=Streptomyces prasinosporus TaxID=68256 RepID=A0ABP6TPF4_9ACTN
MAAAVVLAPPRCVVRGPRPWPRPGGGATVRQSRELLPTPRHVGHEDQRPHNNTGAAVTRRSRTAAKGKPVPRQRLCGPPAFAAYGDNPYCHAHVRHPLTYQAGLAGDGLRSGYPTARRRGLEAASTSTRTARLTLGILSGLNSRRQGRRLSDWTVTPVLVRRHPHLRTHIVTACLFVYAQGTGRRR